MAIRGIPDVIVCHNGNFYGLEIKRSIWEIYYKRTLGIKIHGRAVLQYHNLQKINKSGGNGVFVYPENLLEVVEAIKKGKKLDIPLKLEGTC